MRILSCAVHESYSVDCRKKYSLLGSHVSVEIP